jgi:hypothetical protein
MSDRGIRTDRGEAYPPLTPCQPRAARFGRATCGIRLTRTSSIVDAALPALSAC